MYNRTFSEGLSIASSHEAKVLSSFLRHLKKSKMAESLDFTEILPLLMFQNMLYGNLCYGNCSEPKLQHAPHFVGVAYPPNIISISALEMQAFHV